MHGGRRRGATRHGAAAAAGLVALPGAAAGERPSGRRAIEALRRPERRAPGRPPALLAAARPSPAPAWTERPRAARGWPEPGGRLAEAWVPCQLGRPTPQLQRPSSKSQRSAPAAAPAASRPPQQPRHSNRNARRPARPAPLQLHRPPRPPGHQQRGTRRPTCPHRTPARSTSALATNASALCAHVRLARPDLFRPLRPHAKPRPAPSFSCPRPCT